MNHLRLLYIVLVLPLGVYAGSKIENYLAFGQMLIQVITPLEKGNV